LLADERMNDIDAEMREKHAWIERKIGCCVAKRLPDLIAAHDVAYQNRGSSEKRRGTGNIASGQEGSDARATRWRATNEDGRHNGYRETVLLAEGPERRRISCSLSSKAKRSADDNGFGMELIGKHYLGKPRWRQIADFRKRCMNDAIDGAKQQLVLD